MRVVVRKQTQRMLIRDAETFYRDAEKEIDSNIRDSAEKAWVP